MRFSGCIGHDKPIKMISRLIENGCFSGAYIFSGPEGIGKKMIAVMIARELNGASETREHPDVHIIDNGNSQIKIEDIRAMQHQASLRPYEGKMNVFIIDNSHRLNPEAANSLLKLLEEPPRHCLFILVTHKPQNIFKTVLSRCKVVKFSPLPRQELESFLIRERSLDKQSAHFLAYYAEGRVGLALKLMDSGMAAEKNRILDSFFNPEKAADRDISGQNKEELRAFLNILASWFRDIYLFKAGLGQREAIHADRESQLLKLSRRFSFKQLDDIVTCVSESFMYLDNNINSKLLLHNLGAKLWTE